MSTTDPSPRFEILGRLRAWRDDEELDLGPGKQRAVLAVLLLNVNRPVSTNAIVDAVWEDDPPDNGANVVQKYVAGLRRVLEPDRSPRTPGRLLKLTPAGYALHVPPQCLDAELFQRDVQRALAARADDPAQAAAALRAALAMWRGPALAGLTGRVFDAARERLAEERAAALETCVEIELEQGRHAHLVPELIRLVADFPLREQPRHLLMLALYRCGRQAEALAAYRDAREFFAAEFGVEPGDRLRQLHMRILRSDPTLAGPAAATAPPAPPTAPPPAPAPPMTVPPTPLPQTPVPHHGLVPPAVPPYAPRRTPWWLRIILIGIPPLTFGTGTCALVGYYAGRRRSRLLWLAAAGYLLLTIVFWAIMGTAEEDGSTPYDLPATAAALVTTLGGMVHVALLTAGPVTDPAVMPPPAVVAMIERGARREQARALVAHHPAVARELHVGRPDLPRAFDDGGLVDVNAVPEHVLAGLPGIDPYHAKLIVTVRQAHGPFASVDDLVIRGVLPATVVRSLNDVLVAVPEPAPAPTPEAT
ncbi:BTAD domain-containing putative transcriptional regulator [Actinomadura sp. NPDC047616]|uniref:BTAD domain-containing putative transcriptional regulator n=1 Tax=Actinomadura sp. NPDC047616 TaxID=3155914 RepID=UPI0033DABE6F